MVSYVTREGTCMTTPDWNITDLRSVQECSDIIVSGQGSKSLYTNCEAVLTTEIKQKSFPWEVYDSKHTKEFFIMQMTQYKIFCRELLKWVCWNPQPVLPVTSSQMSSDWLFIKHSRSLNAGAFAPFASWIFKQTHKHTGSTITVKDINEYARNTLWYFTKKCVLYKSKD